MTAQILDGKALAQERKTQIAAEAARFREAQGRAPMLVVVLVGHHPASEVYVASKGRQAAGVGVDFRLERLAADAPLPAILDLVASLNRDPSVDGILVQLPLPRPEEQNVVVAAIDPDKDVDGLTPVSAGRLLQGQDGLRPCTPLGSLKLARKALGDDLSGARCVVVGRSILVGKPAANLFLNANCTVTVAHSRTTALAAACREADILVAAVGRPEMVKGDWIKPGACVIDVGINRVPAPEKGEDATKLVGDVAFDEAMAVAAHLTPVPGGVGPMTVAELLGNTVLAAQARAKVAAAA